MKASENMERSGSAACLLSKSGKKTYVLQDCSTKEQIRERRKIDREAEREAYRQKCIDAVKQGKVSLSLYGKGGILNGLPSMYGSNAGKKRGKGNRKRITHASEKSLRRFAFILSTGSVNWWAIVTLTFRDRDNRGREALRDWCDSMPFDLKSGDRWAWVREYQGRGVVHYHVLLTKEAFIRDGWSDADLENWQIVGSGKSEREVLRGKLDHFIVGHWIHAVRDYSPEFLAFQRGGIVERVREPEKMAGYMARYLGKEHQKTLPSDIPPGGRWWFVSPASFPTCQGTVNVEDLGDERQINKFVFDCGVSSLDVWGLAPYQLDPLQDERVRQPLDATASKTSFESNLEQLKQLKRKIA